MNGADDLQKLWQGEERIREEPSMWRALVQEKRTAWFDLVRAEDQAWYLLALCLSLMTGWAAWKGRYPWVSAGYGMIAAVIVISAIWTWIAGRGRRQNDVRSLREDLEDLIAAYDGRVRYVRRGGWSVMLALCVGLVAIVLGIPGNAEKASGWTLAVLLVAGALGAEWVYCRQTVSKILRKREEASQLLRRLVEG